MANDKGSKYISSKRSYSTAVKHFTVVLEVKYLLGFVLLCV